VSRQVKTFIKTYDYKEIAANSADMVFKQEIGQGQVGFVDKIGNSWAVNTVYEIYIDGQVFMTLNRQLASLTDPHIFRPPVVFHRSISFFGINKTAAAVTFEVVCDGMIYDDFQNI